MFRGSDREIRDEAEKRKPLCVSSGHWHNNPSLPSQESNDLCVNPQWVGVFLAGDRWGMHGRFLFVRADPSQGSRIMKA